MRPSKVTQAAGCLLVSALLVQPFGVAAAANAADTANVAGPVQQGLPQHVELNFPQQVNKLYAASNMQPLWQNEEATRAFLVQLNELALAGINPRFTQWVKEISNTHLSEMARDKLLSDAMLGYLGYVQNVGANGSVWLYGNNKMARLPAPPPERVLAWLKAKDQNRLTAFIDSLAPMNPQYPKMQKALHTLLEEQHEKGWPQLVTSTTLRPGEYSPMVIGLAQILRLTGDLPADYQDNGDDLYNATLVSAVESFQARHGLATDGVIGPRTRFWLNQDPQARATLLALNMQRLRLLPAEKTNGIWVNIPDYRLDYFRDGKKVLDSKVIVGRPARKTPFMHSQLNNVVLNPPWSVPTKLIREDIIPKVKQNPSYLAQHGYVILSDWTENAYEISPYDIDWSMMSAKNFPYRLKQAPGDGNSLGRYKFNMPNSEAIYLHDTPSKGLFGKDIRALSSGCVRVNKAAELADMLLGEVGWNQSRIENSLNKGKTQYVTIRNRVPVQIYYLSSWVGDDGQVQYRTDIYDYDKVPRPSAVVQRNLRQLLN
ncbi:murein L,D-transpeptidase [Plesiomonas shigelloides]|uniref:L,D-transpeptidase n=1 Tax=Plesiomonas shigelloides TaxID=703 RepID=UPI0007EC7386|nr:L,D-transpeptidase [Plesiomonas shigelloides]SBT60766.1 murein L,D-transpeptidase [Plesiomonas shigelloides]